MHEISIPPRANQNKQSSSRKIYVFTSLIVISVFLFSVVASYSKYACLYAINYLTYGFDPGAGVINLCRINIFIGPIALLAVAFLNWRIYRKYVRRDFILKGILPSIIILLIFGTTLFGPFFEPIHVFFAQKSMEKKTDSIAAKPEKVCYMISDDEQWTQDNVVRWEGRVQFPAGEMSFISNIGQLSGSSFESVGGLSTNGREFIDEKFITDSYLSDGKEHNMRVDFPFRIGDAEDLDKPQGSFFGFSISLASELADVPFYHYAFSGKLKNVLEGSESNYWLPYCQDISGNSL